MGVINIVRFNWGYYFFSALLLLSLSLIYIFSTKQYAICITVLFFTVAVATLASLLVSYYVYDASDLYKLKWLRTTGIHDKILNITAGFDEISVLLKDKYPGADLVVFDFYDKSRHTEISIERARRAYPAFPGTRTVATNSLPLPGNSVDQIYVILAAHEIRNDTERARFFRELNRVLKQPGNIIVTEHLRDLPNFLAYNIGFFHFLSKSLWLKTFREAGLIIKCEIKITPFISTFILGKNGITT